MSRHRSKQQGFTLIETLLYVVIFSIFAGGYTAFLSHISSARMGNQVILEVNDQGTNAINVITQTIRNATSITSPTPGNSGATLTIVTSQPSTNPTVFSVNAGILYITEGSGAAIALTNNQVTVSNLTFSNLTPTGASSTIRASFKLANATTKSLASENYSSNFYGTATLRK